MSHPFGTRYPLLKFKVGEERTLESITNGLANIGLPMFAHVCYLHEVSLGQELWWQNGFVMFRGDLLCFSNALDKQSMNGLTKPQRETVAAVHGVQFLKRAYDFLLLRQCLPSHVMYKSHPSRSVKQLMTWRSCCDNGGFLVEAHSEKMNSSTLKNGARETTWLLGPRKKVHLKEGTLEKTLHHLI